ncbi:ADH_N domain-containing protein [Meloidogyne graminicola]|uniref:Enoyl-[acyl-carrier-protein] reductase, mitochondrial n=1 Tax=Meloidogyne graminicola TaxID=189291 RepID=A0A8T0A1S7_9BILA|nr:ADH_N domain-containing protein [Meloidogyne graminicola]
MQTTLWTKTLQFESFGNPNDVILLCTLPVDPRKWNENTALIKWIASPINLLDINIIKGNYSIINKNKFPYIGGTEGVGIVERIGSNVKHFKIGDYVINISYLINNKNKECNRIWTEWDIVNSDLLISVDKNIPLLKSATLSIIPSLAWILIKEFINLEPGDWIIQNGVNTEIGQIIIQLAKAFGYFTLNIITDNEDLDSFKNLLYNLGANKVINEKSFLNEIRNKNYKILTNGQLPRLALNCIGEKSSYLISLALEHSGVFITYDYNNESNVEISNKSFIFNNISAYGFSFMGINLKLNKQKIEEMFKQIQLFILENKLKLKDFEMVPMAKYCEAIEKTSDSDIKQILLISEEFIKQQNKDISKL